MKRYMYSDLYKDVYETEEGEYVDAEIAQSLYDILEKIAQFQEDTYGDGMTLHMGMIGLAKEAKESLAKADKD